MNREKVKKMATKSGQIHEKAIVVDGISATYLKDFNEEFIRNLKKGGVTAIHITVPDIENMSFPNVAEELSGWFQRLRSLESQGVQLVTTAEEIRDAKKNNAVAVILGSQGAGFLGLDLNSLELFYRMGMRTMQPTYQHRNQFGNGCGEKNDSGLSNLGVKWVEEMNKLGMLISLSHAGYKTSMDVMEISKNPVVFDHSNPKALCDVPRNITDDQIQSCAEGGGVVGLCPLSLFVGKDKSPKDQTLRDYLNHIDYVAELVGINHVGIGTDYAENHYLTAEQIMEQRRMFPKIQSKAAMNYEDELLRSGRDKIYVYETHVSWLKSISEFPIITEALLEKGYSVQEIEKILGRNFLRVFEKVWGN
jgi:membrane dipeptidase